MAKMSARGRAIRIGIVLLVVCLAVSPVILSQYGPWSGPAGGHQMVTNAGTGLMVYSSGDDIFVMRSDGAYPLNLTATAGAPVARNAWEPVMSANCLTGDRIAFMGPNRGIWTMNMNGTNVGQISAPAVPFRDRNPHWRANCSEVAYFRLGRGGRGSVHIVNVGPHVDVGSDREISNTANLDWGGGSAFSMGSGDIVKIAADNDTWRRDTHMWIDDRASVWVYPIDDPEEGEPCFQSGRTPNVCGLQNLNLGVQLSSNPGCAIQLDSYQPRHLDRDEFARQGCWTGEPGELEFKFSDRNFDDNSGGIYVIMTPVAH